MHGQKAEEEQKQHKAERGALAGTSVQPTISLIIPLVFENG